MKSNCLILNLDLQKNSKCVFVSSALKKSKWWMLKVPVMSIAEPSLTRRRMPVRQILTLEIKTVRPLLTIDLFTKLLCQERITEWHSRLGTETSSHLMRLLEIASWTLSKSLKIASLPRDKLVLPRTTTKTTWRKSGLIWKSILRMIRHSLSKFMLKMKKARSSLPAVFVFRLMFYL